MASWVKAVDTRESPKFKKIEILENLPGIWLEN
jgi:hypothetical protein